MDCIKNETNLIYFIFQSIEMDLSCPSFLLDQLDIKDETSEYGSRETSDSESIIEGLCLLHGYSRSQGD